MGRLNAPSPGNAGQTQSRGGHFELKSGGDIRARLKKNLQHMEIYFYSVQRRDRMRPE